MATYDEKKIYDDDYTTTTQVMAPTDEHSGAYAESIQPTSQGLKRGLKSRHIAMISIGGVIGTGLFLGTGGALRNGGPLGLFMGYCTVGLVCLLVMVSLGEMVAYLPIAGGHIKLAERFVDKALAFAMGWNYWYNWVIILPVELVASAILINLWTTQYSNALWISVCLALVCVINFMGSGVFGECEFWFASIKVITIVSLILLGIIISAGGGPDHKAHGFEYWRNPGPLVQYKDIPGSWGRFLGYYAVINQAAFSFIGTEIVAIAAGEAKDPRRNLPRAIKRVYVRILLFYLGGTFVIGMITPSNDPGLLSNRSNALGSPFVLAIKRAGIPVLPTIINAALLTSAWSAASSDLYTSSRALYGLAISGQAPKIFARTTKTGLPYVSLIICSLFGGLAYMSLSKGAAQVFNWLANLTACAGLVTWAGICITYIRFHAGMKAQGIDRKTLPYHSILNHNAIGAKVALGFISIFLLFSGWTSFHGAFDSAGFFTNYLPLMMFPLLIIGAKLINKSRFIRASEMDFISDIAEIEAEEWPQNKPTTLIGKFWDKLM